ncbi:MAG: tRNA preQ1(34) S-adenosylmethionine ribosyltransferase-isomerase QueA [Treponema sp.]|nr:tRNA preQ1(34) S-adenosylmethionine ribosyltransferase-isomerase QueA [Treponema sp.]
MKTSDFFFDLPPELIAKYPSPVRGQSRLLVMDRKTKSFEHRMVSDLPSILFNKTEKTLMVFNNSRVRKARLYGYSLKGGPEEGALTDVGAAMEFLLLERMQGNVWKVLPGRARRCRKGSRFLFPGDVRGEIIGSVGDDLLLEFERQVDDGYLDLHGHVPLPPYIKREDTGDDAQRYQTVYADEYGSAAAPTAGLHFTEGLLAELSGKGVDRAFITLHVGLGTFLPVRTENVEDHRMHEEFYSIDEETAGRIGRARAAGKSILAVGTTSLRTLESGFNGASTGGIKSGDGRTSIFIYPGYKFKAVDALFTNFHTPGSTLLMLVSAFAGRDFILKAYAEAITEGYKFYSYGDACLIL